MNLKCFICAKDFITQLAIVCESIGIVFGFHMVLDHTKLILLIVAQWTNIWARVQPLNKLFKIHRSIEGALKHNIMVRGNFYWDYYTHASCFSFVTPILVDLKCAICAEDFFTELAVVRKCVWIMFGFHMVLHHIKTILLIVAQWTDIWARVQSLNKLFKILGFYDRTYKRKRLTLLTSQRPSPSPKPKAPKSPKKGKRNLASGLVTKILLATTPPHPTTPNF